MEMRPILPRDSAHTPRRAGSLTIAGVVGHATLDRTVALLRPLREALGGEIMLVDDGTLGGADRVKLARACDDPALLAARAGDAAWTLLRAALEGRRNAYWLALGDPPALDLVVPDLARAIAANRSFALLDDAAPTGLEPHLETLAREGWPYLPASPDLIGYAAGGDGMPLVAAIGTRLEATGADIARALPGFLLARERDPVLLRDAGASVHSPGRNSLV